jgi:hypothetical protein
VHHAEICGVCLAVCGRRRRSHPAAGLPDLWLSERGNHSALSYMGLRFSITERAELAGIKNFHLHLMRHTEASMTGSRTAARRVHEIRGEDSGRQHIVSVQQLDRMASRSR